MEPTDFCREAGVSCKCADCKELIAFLKDAAEKVHRFRIRQDRRRHLEEIIDNKQCDLEYVTDPKGSPQTLVCTKNTASFHRKLKKYYEDKEHLAKLRSIETAMSL